MGKPVLFWEPCYSLATNHSVGCMKSKDWHTVGRSCLFWSSVFAMICPLKNPPNFCHFDDIILNLCIHSLKNKMFYIRFFLSVFFFASFFFYTISLFSCTWRRKFSVEGACVSLFPCVLSYRWIHFPRSVLSVLLLSPVVVHSFLRKRMFSFIFMKSHG